MNFLAQLLDRLPRNGVPVRGVWIGPYWTAVQTDLGTGLATTLLDAGPTHGEHAQRLPGAGKLTAAVRPRTGRRRRSMNFPSRAASASPR